MDAEKLKKIMEKKNISAQEMATATDMDISTWYRKIQKNGETFNIREMDLIIKKLKIDKTEAASLFFGEKLA